MQLLPKKFIRQDKKRDGTPNRYSVCYKILKNSKNTKKK